MSDKILAVIGGGQMGRALVGGMLASNVVTPEQLKLVEPAQLSQTWWLEHHPGVEIADSSAAVSAADAVLMAVKPNIMEEVAKQISGDCGGKLVISIAAGIGLVQLRGWIGHKRVVRVMPNTPSLVREGASAYCCGREVSEEDKHWIESMLGSVGLAVEVDERQMDAVTGLSGSGPAYVCMMIEAMADGGVLEGLPRQLAMQLATQTVLGTAKMIAETKRHPGELKDAVASPGGTTIAAISVLEQNGVRGAFVAAVAASARRSRELGGNE
jgi:pyrroline-5-carboxylate reductase